MHPMMRLASAAAGLATAALVHAQGADELWQITSRMEMEGMQLPAISQQVCMKKGETRAEDLGQQDPNCKVTEQHRAGNKLTWKVVCTGERAMTGTGEMTRNRDTLEGRMQMKSKEGDMKVAYSGKLAGTCNAQTHEDPQQAALKRQMASMQAQSNAEIARVCQEGIEKFSTDLFERQGMPCVDRKGAYCAHVKKTGQAMGTPAAYRAAMQKQGMGGGGWERAAQFCSVQTAPIAAAACKGGVSGRDWAFVADYCPAETKKLAGEHCAGRDYTTAMSSEYKPICAKYAGTFAQPQRAATQPAAPAAPSAADAVKEGTRALRNLFGR